jgi:phenylacetate-CoA ligase
LRVKGVNTVPSMSPLEPFAWLKAIYDRARVLRLSREQLEAEQRTKFRKLVALAYERSPFYRSLIDERSIDLAHCRPTDFPVLTKRIVAENFDQMLTDRRLSRARIEDFLSRSHDPGELLDGRFHVLHSSGTSGTVGHMVYSHEAWIKGASQMLRVLPLRLRTRVAFVAAADGHFAGASLLVTGNYGTNRLFFDVRTYDVSHPMDQIVAALNVFQPHALTGYAGILERLCDFQEAGSLRIRPRVIVSGAEPLRPRCRALLQKTFQAPVVNAYASSEHLFMALSLPGSDGMYLLEDDLIFELRDDCTYVTNLMNDTLPLIRYRMDDVLVADSDPTGRYPLTKIRDLVGRSEDSLVFRNRDGAEDFIHPSLIGELLVPGLKSWQIQVVDESRFVFRARFESCRSREQKQAISGQIRDRLVALLAEKRMDNVDFEIKEVDRMQLDPASGKTRMILRPIQKERVSNPRKSRRERGVASGNAASCRRDAAKVSPEQRATVRPRILADGRETKSKPSR